MINLADFRGHILKDHKGRGLFVILYHDSYKAYKLFSIFCTLIGTGNGDARLWNDSESAIIKRIERGEDTGLTIMEFGELLEKRLIND